MVAFRASATGITTSGTDGTSITITKPTGTVDGDVMVAVVAGYNPVTLTPPSNWVRLNDSAIADSTGLYNWAYYRVASSEGASYTWTWSGAGGALIGSITSFSDSSGLDDWAYSVTSTTDPSTSPTVRPTRESFQYNVYSWRDDSDDTVTWSVGTERFDTFTKDVGTIRRGMSGVTHAANVAADAASTSVTANPTNSVTFGINWTFMLGTNTTAESWSSTGFGVDFDLDGTWTDVTSYIRAETQIEIQRGKASQGGEVNPSTASFVLENADGRFSPKNPTGAYYGTIGRNTPCRIWKAQGTVAFDTPGQLYDRFRTPAAEQHSIGGDLDVRVDCEPESWRQEAFLAGKVTAFASSLGQWAFYIDDGGYLNFEHTNGALTVSDVQSTLPVPAAVRQTVRATIDVNNGSSGHTVTFYYGTGGVGGSFTQLGDAVVTSGTTTIDTDNDIALTVGANEPENSNNRFYPPYKQPFRGRIYGMQLRDGIAGTIVANPDFSAQTTGTYDFTDSVLNTWVAVGNAVNSNRRYRFHGEISEWPQRWDSTGNDVYVEIEASGLLRRIQQGESPIKSAMYRYYTNEDGIFNEPGVSSGKEGPFFPLGYWPMEDLSGASRFASAFSGGRSMTINGAPTLADYTGFAASDALPAFKTNSSAEVKLKSRVTGGFTVEFLLSAPSGITNGADIIKISVTGGTTYTLSYPSTDTLTLTRVTAEDASSSSVGSGSLAASIAGELNRIIITSDGTNVDVLIQEITASEFTNLGSVPDVGNNLIGVTISPEQLLNDVYIGHLAVFDGTLSPNSTVYRPDAGIYTTDPINAYSGETADARAKRLIEEEGFVSYGIGAVGTTLGYQSLDSLVNILREVENTDGGYLYEPRNIFGFGYRSRVSMHNTAATLAMTYTSFHLSGEIQGDEDDQGIKNDVTVTRVGGSFSRYEKEEGTLSVLSPPDGVGRYDDSFELSLRTDNQCLQHAGWRVHLGTVDELRYPSLTVELSRSVFTSSSALTTSALITDIGDRITITGQPSFLPPDEITQQVVGYKEVFDKFTHEITFYTIPESPYQIATATTAATSTTQAKAGSSTTTLNEALDTTETGVDIAVESGSASWTTSGVDFDIIIGGERMTVTANSGTTFTVTRSVNGIVKSHASGAEVRLFKPAIAAL